MDRPVGAPHGRGADRGTNPFPPVRAANAPGRPAQRPVPANRPAPAVRPGGGTDLFPARPPRQNPGGGNGRGGNGHGRPPSGGNGGRGPTGPKLIDYPRYGRSGFKRWIPSWKLVLGLFSLMIALIAVMFTVAYASTDIPEADSMVSAQTTTVKFAGKDNAPEIGRLAVQNRKSVTIDQIPKSMQDAMISAEDRSFRTNSGVSPSAIVRAAWNNFRGGSTQGGSTITQQYVKNSFEMRDRTISRKAKEFFIALKINRTMDKDEILTDYLNTIYFGRGAYGIEAASQAYFGIPAQKLDESQSAFLAGVVKGPSLYDPLKSEAAKAGATARWNYVLDGMVTMGSLDAGARAGMTFPEVKPVVKANNRTGYKGYLMDMVVAEAEEKTGLTESQLETGGYTVYTTFDQRLMDEAVKAVDDELYDVKKLPEGTQAGMATIDPTTGAVMSIYGGQDSLKHQLNNATQATMQAGSTFKPFTLIAALQDGISLKSYYNGNNNQEIDGFDEKVKNFGNDSYGNIDLMTATAKSVNTVYAQLNEGENDEGVKRAERTRQVAVAAGVPEDTQDLLANPANVLGTASPHVIDMASAYATIAAGGVWNEPYVIKQIVGPDGETMKYEHTENDDNHKRVFDEDVIADATYAMEQVVLRGSGTYAKALDREVAGKTGTSSSNYSAWFNGFTPQMVTTVGLFRDVDGKQEQLKKTTSGGEVTGAGYPIRIWTSFMEKALGDTKEVDFPDPVYGGEVENGDLAPRPRSTSRPESSGTPSSQPTQTVQPTEPAQPTLPGGGGEDGGGIDLGDLFPTEDTGNGNGNGNGLGQPDGG